MRTAIMAAGLLALACGISPSLTAEERANIDTIRARSAAYNAQAEEWLDAYAAGLNDDFVYQAYGPWAPVGTTTDREGVIAALKTGASYYPDRKSTLLSAIASGDTVVTETEWSGTASDQHPTLEAGERQTMREVFIYQFRAAKIVKMREYAVVVSDPTTPPAEPSKRTATEDANEAAARPWIELFNSGTMDWWDKVYSPDVTWESYGRAYQTRAGEAFKALVRQALEVFPDRAFEVLSLSADGDRVIIETSWSGTAAKEFLGFEPGDRRTSRNILFLTYRDGKIATVTTYVAGETIEKPST